MSKWVLKKKGGDFKAIGKKFGISPILARLIRNKDLVEDKDIFNYLSEQGIEMYSPWLLKDMVFSTELILSSINENHKIRIVGDYDIDGVNASYILWKGITALGGDCDVQIPDRVQDGYGINQSIVQKAIEEKIDLIITCDNGIAAFEAIELAIQNGLKVIVTDHHEVQRVMVEGELVDKVPPATYVINPKQESCPYPFEGICGAVVAYKLIEALFEREERSEDPILLELLENAAIATIGDVMSLVDENRSIVKRGLANLRKTKNLGLVALMEANQINPIEVDVYHIGFKLGPCINAPGRLETANQSLALLRAETKEEASRIVTSLVEINEERKRQTLRGVEEALAIINDYQCLPDVIVIYLPNCHESIAGIVAGRIKELTYHPTFILTDTEDGLLKGSGRSIPTYSMFDKMCEIKDVFLKFGGHPMAAGLSIEKNRLSEFISRINANTSLCAEDFENKLSIDMPLPFQYITLDLVKEMKRLEPFGNGNTKPLFGLTKVKISNPRFLGEEKKVLKLALKDEYNVRQEGIMFIEEENLRVMLQENYEEALVQRFFEGEELEVALAFYPRVNVFQQRESIQIEIKEIG